MRCAGPSSPEQNDCAAFLTTSGPGDIPGRVCLQYPGFSSSRRDRFFCSEWNTVSLPIPSYLPALSFLSPQF